ncbi:MAG: 16S rRNA (guanine(527)-N(7))-methyltransferase RsmG [Granulosicoccus sp.]
MESPASKQLQASLQLLKAQSIPHVSDDLLPKLEHFLQLLAKWNRVYNLTAVRDPVQMVDRHIMDSLIMNRWMPESISVDGLSDVIDIGSGAGLPVIPLAISRPDLSFISIESNGKKTRFQQQAVMELKLPNVIVINERVENVHESAQMVLSRAFTAPKEFLQICLPLCAQNGRVAIMLGQVERFPPTLSEEYELEELVAVDVPGTEFARHVAVCRRQ